VITQWFLVVSCPHHRETGRDQSTSIWNIICSLPALFLPLHDIEITIFFLSIIFRCSDILERVNTNDDDDDDGFDTEEFDSDVSDESPTNEPEQLEYNSQCTQPVVRTQCTFCSTWFMPIQKNGAVVRARKIFEFHLARRASNPQILLARGTYPLAQVFKLINNSWTQEWKSKYSTHIEGGVSGPKIFFRLARLVGKKFSFQKPPPLCV